MELVKYHIAIILICLLSARSTLVAQPSALGKSADSLIALANRQHGMFKINTLNELIDMLEQHANTAMYYAKNAEEEALNSDSDLLLAKSQLLIGKAYMYGESYDTAMIYLNRSLSYATKYSVVDLECQTLKQIVDVYWSQKNISDAEATTQRLFSLYDELGNYEDAAWVYFRTAQKYKALKYHQKRLSILLEAKLYIDKHNLSQLYYAVNSLIGTTNLEMGNISPAKKYLTLAFNIAANNKDTLSLAIQSRNIGISYVYKRDLDSALFYFKQELYFQTQLNNKDGIANCYNNIGNWYSKMGRYEEAEKSLVKAMKIFKENDNDALYYMVLSNLVSLYTGNGRYDKARIYIDEIMLNGDRIDNSIIKGIYRYMAAIAKHKGNYKEALRYTELSNAYYDSLNKARNNKMFMEIQQKYETQIKDQEIQSLRKENDIKQLQNEKQRGVQRGLIASIAFLVIVVVTVIVGAKLIKNKNELLKTSNTKLSESEKSLREQNQEILAQNEEILTQKELIQKQNIRIQSSIDYASEIQSAVLPSLSTVQAIFPQSFVLYKPLDVVSGDFYWVSKVGDKKMCMVADCTGHGVPGALMSMLGMSFLSEFINTIRYDELHPNVILDLMRQKVVESLHQSSNEVCVKDGIDAAFFIVDEIEGTLEFSGAEMPIVIVHNGEASIIKGDNYPLGITSHNDVQFNLHRSQICSGDTIYAFSDGYADQIGGDKGRKFLKKNLVSLLQNINSKPIDIQLKMLNQNLIDWQGGYKQIDDVVLLGIRL